MSADTTTTFPHENAAFITTLRAAFSSLPAPLRLQPGQRVWLADYYYPGVVDTVGGASDYATVLVPCWDQTNQRPLVVDGQLVLDRLSYGRFDLNRVRVDDASAAYWPRPSGSLNVVA